MTTVGVSEPGQATQLREEIACQKLLASMFYESDMAQLLLRRAGFPQEYIPRFDDASVFWGKIVRRALGGMLEGGIEPLIRAAREIYRWNGSLYESSQDTSLEQPSAGPQKGPSTISPTTILAVLAVEVVLGTSCGYIYQRSLATDVPQGSESPTLELTDVAAPNLPSVATATSEPPIRPDTSAQTTTPGVSAALFSEESPNADRVTVDLPRETPRLSKRRLKQRPLRADSPLGQELPDLDPTDLEQHLEVRCIREIRSRCSSFVVDQRVTVEFFIDQRWRPVAADVDLAFVSSDTKSSHPRSSRASSCIKDALRSALAAARNDGRPPRKMKFSLE